MDKDNTTFFYQIGGSLGGKSPSYVERQADCELEEALKKGQFCYVLNSRQMGKSSLRVRTMERLQAAEIVCIFIDLTGMGTQDLTPEKWYAGIVRSLVSSCRLKFDWRNWWRENRDFFSPVQRLSLFIEEVLLVEIKSKIVIFIDEIDRVLSQKFSLDDFFALIHSCYQKRQVNQNYRRLTFTLLGVAAARELIRDKTQSPFDLGQSIALEGFKLEEALPLSSGLAKKFNAHEQILAEIVTWTKGQPFLTQKLCQLMLEKGNEKEEIEKIVTQYIINNWEAQDEPEHLRTIRDRLCFRNSSKTIRLLGLYREILQQENISNNNSQEQIELRLSGLVVERQGKLVVNNPIYAKVFNLTWIEARLDELRPYSHAIKEWVNTADSIYLLKGKDLQDALTWALGKSLADIDYQFLVASQELAKQETENALAAVEAASYLLANARQQAQQKVIKKRLAKKWLINMPLVVTGFILLLRSTGVLQIWEWNLLDRFFRWRVTEEQESRVVLVTFDEQDIKQVGQWPIPDRILATAIKNLQAQQPSAIALDIYRDLPVPPGNEELLRLFDSYPNLYAVEKVVGNSIPSPPNVSQQQVGFADQVLDSDGKLRRALLSLVGNDGQTRFSLGTQLALHYLQERDIRLEPMNSNSYRLGKAIFKRFNRNNGGYVRADAGGYQILLNFWGKESNFPQYSLIEVLKGTITPENIRDRLILIGSTATESSKDTFYTPYSQGWFRSPAKMPGVFIHGNVTSQIISAALNNRPLLYTHNQILESLWIFFWGIIGVIISWCFRSSIAIALSVCLTSSFLIIICYLAFLLGWWLPLIPSLLTLTATLITAIILREKQRDRLRCHQILILLSQEYRERPIVSRMALEYLKQSENQDNQILIDKHIQKLPLNEGRKPYPSTDE